MLRIAFVPITSALISVAVLTADEPKRPLRLPEAINAKPLDPKANGFYLNIGARGGLFVVGYDQPLAGATAEKWVATQVEAMPRDAKSKLRVIVRADRDTPAGVVFKIARPANAVTMEFRVSKPSEKGEATEACLRFERLEAPAKSLVITYASAGAEARERQFHIAEPSGKSTAITFDKLAEKVKSKAGDGAVLQVSTMERFNWATMVGVLEKCADIGVKKVMIGK